MLLLVPLSLNVSIIQPETFHVGDRNLFHNWNITIDQLTELISLCQRKNTKMIVFVEQGSHEELMARQGMYANLIALDLQGDVKED